MPCLHKRLWIVPFALLPLILISPLGLRAADHVVSESSMQQALVNASTARQKNEAQVEKFFSSPEARAALKKAHLSLRQIQNAVPSLDNQDLAQLARRTQKVQNDFAAGALTNERLTYIVIALATAVIVILIFEA